MSTPSDELRAAATLLRETARAATPGPWGVETVVRDSIGAYSYPGHSFVATIGDRTADEYVVRDAAWITLANPELAEPLADLLDSIADEHERPPCDAPEACNRCAEPDPVVIDALRLVLNVNRGAK